MPITSVTSSLTSPGLQASRLFEEKGVAPRTLTAPPAEAQPGGPPAEGTGFEDLVKGFIGDVNHLQLRGGRAVDALAAGEIADVHQVTVAVAEAGMALDLLLQVRNRVTEAFQEIMRLQV
jgi:flagellar hook-basal body complex protein FliE